ncbi:hypothetical protein D9756_009822 [Leucocoprinus leucothites]|uniref:Uncharacterized protein n=1 Tax=Leucocoprinus leucothites TaxID=201217 RepID=A0A8H5CVM8_9AGAR|nr:hypothetical protein D9756_009822 [Leucoagaricus leucothites]
MLQANQAYTNQSLWDCLGFLVSECNLGRLVKEDPGVLAPVWFGRKPDSFLHIIANLLRLIIGIPCAPLYLLWSFVAAPWRQAFKRIARWEIEWPHIPDAIISEPPSACSRGRNIGIVSGEYAVSNNKPRWLLEVHFAGATISSMRQVVYGADSVEESLQTLTAVRRSIQNHGYTAISYPMKSATHMYLYEAKRHLDVESERKKPTGRELSLANRQLISYMVLECYAEARAMMPNKVDGAEYIWLDEFCLSDAQLSMERDVEEIDEQRGLEVGRLTDIFGGARRVVVFCHEMGCDHADIKCPWGRRLFTLGEIMHTPEVLQMTRQSGDRGGLTNSISVIPGPEFRGSMQTRAARAKMWHLYNIMQHSTNAGSVTWQSAIHSLVVEAIRRDEAEGFHMHNMLGKALNGLLPRRSQLEDLQGTNGWADLAWLLELNQGYYNAAALAAVCRIADPWVGKYRWWGKPIAPREGCERLEPLATAIPVNFRDEGTDTLQPVLSIIGPKSVEIRHVLRRDGSAFFRNPNMKNLRRYSTRMSVVALFMASALISIGSFLPGLVLLYVICVAFTTTQFFAGTIHVKKDGWVVYEDRLFPNHDPIPFIRRRDPSYLKMTEWGDRQLIPRWDVSTESHVNGTAEEVPRPYRVTLVDLQTGVYTKAMVTDRPNNMVVLAVHGSGITCMLLKREEKPSGATVSAKVGMANVPPVVLAHAGSSGTVYVAGEALCEKPWDLPPTRIAASTLIGSLRRRQDRLLSPHTVSQFRRGEGSTRSSNVSNLSNSSTPFQSSDAIPLF